MARPWYPWNDASLRSRFPAVSSALADGRLTLEPSEWELTETDLTEALEWFRLCYAYSCWAALHHQDPILDWEATRKDYQVCYLACSASLYYLDDTDWAPVPVTVFERAALDPRQSYLD